MVAGTPSPEHAHLVGVQVGIELIQRLGEAFQVDQAFLTQLMVVFDELAVGGGVDGANNVAILIPIVIHLAGGIQGHAPGCGGVHQPGGVDFIAEIEGDFIVGVAVAVRIHIAEGYQHFVELFHGGGHFHAYALQPLGVDILDALGYVHARVHFAAGQAVDVAVGIGLVFAPAIHIGFIEVIQVGHVGFDFVFGDHMPQLGILRDDAIGHGLASPEDVRQGGGS